MIEEFKIFIGFSDDAKAEAEKVYALEKHLQKRFKHSTEIAKVPFRSLKMFLWTYDAKLGLGGQETAITPDLAKSQIAVFVFKLRIGSITWKELEYCRQNNIPILAVFPSKYPNPESLNTDIPKVSDWLNLLKKKRSLTKDWASKDSKSVTPIKEYNDAEHLVAIMEERILDLFYEILKKSISESNQNIDQDNIGIQNKQMGNPLLSEEKLSIENPFIISGIKKIQIDPQLRLDYTFDNFVEGGCNHLARRAGYAVSNHPGGTAFNPLMIYGNSALGKTHLIHAIGIEVKERFPDKVVLCVNSNKFQSQLTEAIRENKQNEFLRFYQMIDVLIIDDIHEFAEDEKTQETFIHIFDHLYQSGKQLIFTVNKSPTALKGFEQHLLSRFKWGLTVELQQPSFETRLNILRRKIYNDGIEISEEVLEYIASHITNNIRELEGALVSLLAISSLYRKEITVELASEVINKLV